MTVPFLRGGCGIHPCLGGVCNASVGHPQVPAGHPVALSQDFPCASPAEQGRIPCAICFASDPCSDLAWTRANGIALHCTLAPRCPPSARGTVSLGPPRLGPRLCGFSQECLPGPRSVAWTASRQHFEARPLKGVLPGMISEVDLVQRN